MIDIYEMVAIFQFFHNENSYTVNGTLKDETCGFFFLSIFIFYHCKYHGYHPSNLVNQTPWRMHFGVMGNPSL